MWFVNLEGYANPLRFADWDEAVTFVNAAAAQCQNVTIWQSDEDKGDET